jgi:hypothetical protein
LPPQTLSKETVAVIPEKKYYNQIGVQNHNKSNTINTINEEEDEEDEDNDDLE